MVDLPNLSSAKTVVIDIETCDPLLTQKGVSWVYGDGYVICIGIKCDNNSAYCIPARDIISDETIQTYLSSINRSAIVIGHYINYDTGWLNYKYNWLHPGKFSDTLLMAQLERNDRYSYSLDRLCKIYELGEKIEVDRTILYKLPYETIEKYCKHDVELTYKLYKKLENISNTEACERECALIPILIQMKRRGIKIDMEKLNEIQESYDIAFYEIMNNLPEVSNIWSASDIMYLCNKLNIWFPKTDKNRPSFPKWFLDSQEHPKLKNLAAAREIDKLRQFCVSLKHCVTDNYKVHPDFFNGRSEYGGTITGRFSAANPNVQQIPHRTERGKKIREVFKSTSGRWYKFDYSQQEPRLMLHYASKLNLTGIQQWRDMYKDSSADFYKPIQEMMNIERFPAKTLTLAISYNMGYNRLARIMNIDEEKAKEYLFRFKKTVPWMQELKTYVMDKAIKAGKIKTIGNRYLHFDTMMVNTAFNYLIQGSAADQIKQAMCNIYQMTGHVPLLQVHDELAYEFEENIPYTNIDMVDYYMKNAIQLDFPVKVDINYGNNWGECG